MTLESVRPKYNVLQATGNRTRRTFRLVGGGNGGGGGGGQRDSNYNHRVASCLRCPTHASVSSAALGPSLEPGTRVPAIGSLSARH